MPLKIAAFCLEASPDTLRPLWYRGTHRLQGGIYAASFTRDLFRLFRWLGRFWKAISSKKSSQFLVPGGVEVWTSRGPILGAGNFWKVHPQSLVNRFGFWVGNELCWKSHSWPLKRVIICCCTTPCSSSTWYAWIPVSNLSCKNEDVSTTDGRSPNKPWRRMGEGIPATSECTSKDFWA